MVERVLARLPDLHLAVDRGALPRRPANSISGIEEMPVEFTPTAPSGSGPSDGGAVPPTGGIAGRSILVTGGGSGIGLGQRRAPLAEGAHVTICGRTEQKLADAAARIAGAAAPRCHPASTSSPTSPSRNRSPQAVARPEATGRIDGLFACAGRLLAPRAPCSPPTSPPCGPPST